MKSPVNVAARILVLFGLSCLVASGPLLNAQAVTLQPSKATTFTIAPAIDQSFVPSTIRGTVRLDGPWHFHAGDDPRWADPSFDDSSWDKVKPGSSPLEQGIDPTAGYGWYRLHLRPVPIPDSGVIALSLLVVPHTVGQLDVFVNGVEAAHTRGMTDNPALYRSPPFQTELTRAGPDGTVLIAIRSWSNFAIGDGPLDHVEVGDPNSIGERMELRPGGNGTNGSSPASSRPFSFSASQRCRQPSTWRSVITLNTSG